MTNDVIITRRSQRIFYVTMNRPQVMNAINLDILEGLGSALEHVASDDRIRVVVLKGAGGNFCAGADMSMLDQGWEAPQWFRVMKRFGKVIRALRDIPQPVVVQVEGAAFGGGFNLALAGDFIVAAHSAKMCQSFVNIGVALDGGGTYFLPRLVGLSKARELSLLGEEIDGKKAAALGLIYKSVPSDGLEMEVNALAETLSKKALLAMGLIKEGLESSLDMSLKDVLEWETAHQSVLFQTNEHKSAVREFLNSHRKK